MGGLADLHTGIPYGLIYGIAAIGLSIPLRVLRTADLTSLGAHMVGGVIFISAANNFGCAIGLLLAVTSAGALGAITAAMYKVLRIPLLLAGIVTLTASRSIGFVTADNGTVVLTGAQSPLEIVYNAKDVFLLAGIGLAISIGLGAIARTKWAAPFFGLHGSDRFVRYRLKSATSSTYWTLFLGNSLVGLSGALFAAKTHAAHVDGDPQNLLSISLAAIFAGDACVRLVSKFLKREIPVADDLPDSAASEGQSIVTSFRHSLSPQRDDIDRLWFVFVSYLVASVALNAITLAVVGQKLGFEIPAAFQHVVVAVFIFVGLILSRSKASVS